MPFKIDLDFLNSSNLKIVKVKGNSSGQKILHMKFEFLAKFHHGVTNIDNNLDSDRPFAILSYFILTH